MKRDKAIEILALPDPWPQKFSKDDLKDAINLGMEALKLYKTIKADGLRAEDFLLPGETKD